MKMPSREAFAAVIICLVASVAHAESVKGIVPRGAVLEQGLSATEVLKRWGAPVEREERETKRQELWRYVNSEVLLENGKVLSWRGPPVRQAATEQAGSAPLQPVRQHPAKPLEDSTITEILNELQGYSSSAPASSSSDAVAPPNMPRPTPMGMYAGRAEMPATGEE